MDLCGYQERVASYNNYTRWFNGPALQYKGVSPVRNRALALKKRGLKPLSHPVGQFSDLKDGDSDSLDYLQEEIEVWMCCMCRYFYCSTLCWFFSPTRIAK